MKALLAQFGDDSEDENMLISLSKTSKPVPVPTKNVSNALPMNSIDNNSDADDEDTPVQVPRGKIAARLLAQGAREAPGADGEDAYTRIRRQLLSRKGKQNSEDKLAQNEYGSDKVTSGEEEFPIQASRFRRQAKRKSKSPTPRSSPSSTPPSRGSSPGLFVSPRATSPTRLNPLKQATVADSDSDALPNPVHNARFQELVARKRAERKAQEEEKLKLEALSARSRRSERVDSDSDEDGEAGRRLTQQARPTRKASKKALEELSRETQRMNRNMQLAHQAKTKKKITTKDLFARFNFRQEDAGVVICPEGVQENNASSVLASSDVEGQHEHDTPPTSPPSQDGHSVKEVEGSAVLPAAAGNIDINEELPNWGEIQDEFIKRVDKGKGRAVESQHIPINPRVVQTTRSVFARNVRVVLPNKSLSKEIDLDSDEDLQIVKTKSRFPVFDHLPKEKNKDSRSLLTLRALAHLVSPGKQRQNGRISMNPVELQASLQRRARQQAQIEREEKLNELRARGVLILTEEEREKDQLELENLLERARKEAMELAKKEKGDAKKDGKGDAEQGFMDSEDEEDGDWEGSDDEDVEDDGGVELSGSEEEVQVTEELEGEGSDEESVDEDEDANETMEFSGLFNREAEEDGEEDSEQDNRNANEEASDEETIPVPVRQHTLNRPRHVIDEDDSDDGSQKSKPSQSTLDDGMAAFGFDNANATSLGLTQMFAGTIANLQSQSQSAGGLNDDSEQDSLTFLRNVPMATLPDFDTIIANTSQDFIVPNSQVSTSQQKDESTTAAEPPISLDLSQFKSQSQTTFSHTQLSDIPEPTQDVGFELSRSPAGLVAPLSTIDTVIMAVTESPIAKKRGRLLRRREAIPVLSDVDEDEAAPSLDSGGDDEFEISANAFDVMRKAARKPPLVDDFDKKKSEAKGMVEEQAEESEDEYAGLGGQSDDESGGELDEEVAKMIDEGEVHVDERKIAAFYADKERADDEKRIDKLYKDITNGGLRRKRGNDFELSDSDDDAEQRRRRKQKEFAKMRKALLEDESIGKIAQNPKKSAFLRAIEDRDDDPDLDFLGAPGFQFEVEGSESTESVSVPDSQQVATTTATIAQPNPLKRKHISTNSQEKENRPPLRLRRTTTNDTARKPVSLAEIRDSVSFLIDEPHAIPESQFSASESEDEDNRARHAPAHRAIIDRLSLSRETSSINSSAESSGALAFHAPSAVSHQPGFRVPSLIRRATSNLSAKTSTTNSTTSSGTTAPVEGTGVRRGGSGKSNIHYQAREAERRAALEKAEERRREKVRKRVVKGSSRSVLGVLGVGDGGFE